MPVLDDALAVAEEITEGPDPHTVGQQVLRFAKRWGLLGLLHDVAVEVRSAAVEISADGTDFVVVSRRQPGGWVETFDDPARDAGKATVLQNGELRTVILDDRYRGWIARPATELIGRRQRRKRAPGAALPEPNKPEVPLGSPVPWPMYREPVDAIARALVILGRLLRTVIDAGDEDAAAWAADDLLRKYSSASVSFGWIDGRLQRQVRYASLLGRLAHLGFEKITNNELRVCARPKCGKLFAIDLGSRQWRMRFCCPRCKNQHNVDIYRAAARAGLRPPPTPRKNPAPRSQPSSSAAPGAQRGR